MKKLKTLNYKILSTLPVMEVCLTTTSQTSSAMFRSALSFASKVLQTSTKNTINTTSPKTVTYLYRNGTKVSIFDSNPLKNTNPNSSFSVKSSSVNPPTSSTNIYRNSRTLSVLGNDILKNNSSYVPLNLTSKLTPYSPSNTQQPISNKTSISSIKSTTSSIPSTSNPNYNPDPSKIGKDLGRILGNALQPVLELSMRTSLYGIKNNGNDISSLINSNKSYKNVASKWGNILSTALVARLQVDAINNNQNSTAFSKNN